MEADGVCRATAEAVVESGMAERIGMFRAEGSFHRVTVCIVQGLSGWVDMAFSSARFLAVRHADRVRCLHYRRLE